MSKRNVVGFNLTQKEIQKLDEVCKNTGLKRVEVFRQRVLEQDTLSKKFSALEDRLEEKFSETTSGLDNSIEWYVNQNLEDLDSKIEKIFNKRLEDFEDKITKSIVEKMQYLRK